jgi:hypothetical protein
MVWKIGGGLLVLAWLGAVVIGFVGLAAHAARPGRPAPASADPARLGLKKSAGFTLVMFVHPQCPCSVASVDELARLMVRCAGRLTAEVRVFEPSELPADWMPSSLTLNAQAIPDVAVTQDRDGAAARMAGAQTSGQVFLYDPEGHLRFSGGITGSRGHEGDNDGTDAVIDCVLGNQAPAGRVRHTPVFGCAIYSSFGDAPGGR